MEELFKWAEKEGLDVEVDEKEHSTVYTCELDEGRVRILEKNTGLIEGSVKYTGDYTLTAMMPEDKDEAFKKNEFDKNLVDVSHFESLNLIEKGDKNILSFEFTEYKKDGIDRFDGFVDVSYWLYKE